MQEIAGHIEVSEEEVIETMEMSRSYKALSVDYKHEVDSDGGSVSILELSSSNEDDDRKMEVHMLLETALPVLLEREQLILKYIFFDNLIQEEVGVLLLRYIIHVSGLT